MTFPNRPGSRIRSNQIDSGEVNTRVLADGAVTSKKFATDIQSDNFVPGVSGWLIKRVTGNVEFNEGVFRGDVAISGNLEVSGDDGILVFGGGDITIASGGDLIIDGGQLVAGPVELDSDGLKIDGVLQSPTPHIESATDGGNFTTSLRALTAPTMAAAMVTVIGAGSSWSRRRPARSRDGRPARRARCAGPGSRRVPAPARRAGTAERPARQRCRRSARGLARGRG